MFPGGPASSLPDACQGGQGPRIMCGVRYMGIVLSLLSAELASEGVGQREVDGGKERFWKFGWLQR